MAEPIQRGGMPMDSRSGLHRSRAEQSYKIEQRRGALIDAPVAYNLISMSTPAGKSNFISESTVLGVV
jgi:hypothetical protein